MYLKDTPIRRKLMIMLLLTSSAVLLLTCAAFFAYGFVTFRQTTVRQISTLGEMIADNSTAALAFENQKDAKEVLSALKAERAIVAAALYDKEGKIFAKYPAEVPDNALPATPQKAGYHFQRFSLTGFQPVVQGDRHLGALYLELDTGAIMQGWLAVSFGLGVLVIAISLAVAYLLSRKLQQQISQPVLSLAETAKAISDRRDYSVRAKKLGNDELGLLTDAFNQMLAQIQEQNQALSESEARVRAVLDSAISAVVVVDAAGNITDWNARAEQMFGWTRSESLGQKLVETIIPPQYREGHRRGMEHFLATGEGPVLNRVSELSALRRDGSEFPVEISISPLKRGGVMTFCGFITDISERKESEGKLQAQLTRLELLSRITRTVGERQDLPSIFQVVVRSLEDHLPLDFSCACLYDPTDNVLTVTSVGLQSEALATELVETDQARIDIEENGLSRCLHGQLLHEPDIIQAKLSFPQRLARGGMRSLVVAPLVVESKFFGVLVAARRQPRSFSSGECEFLRQVSGHVALASHQAQLYGALQQAYDDLRQTQQAVMQQERLRALGQMASGIAHDINNAMSPVSLYIDSLLETEHNLSERARGYLETIAHAIDDVAATVARMREFYRLREPQLTLAPVQVNPLVQQVVNLTRARWSDMPQQRGMVIKLLTELSPDLPVIMAVESEIREALTNVIFNAVDAMPDGGTLTLRTRVVESAPVSEESRVLQHIYIEVTDTGIGMDEDTRRRCLEPFFTTKGERGTGLGLAMVYGTIQRHSADIEIESAVGKGTTVRLSFSAPVQSTAEPAQSPAKFVVPSRLRILVVDDDPLLIKSLRNALEMDGHVVITTDGGRAGIHEFRAAHERHEPFAVVITDLGMPYVDGRKVASTVKGMSPSTPVILLTGWGQRLVAEGDIPPHVDRVLNKPPKLRDLREALAQCCQPAES